MNSIQLISKLKSKAIDISETVTNLFNESHEISQIEKELLKKHAIDFFELVMKLKTINDFEKPKPIVETNELKSEIITEAENTFAVEEKTNETITEFKQQQLKDENLDEISLTQIEDLPVVEEQNVHKKPESDINNAPEDNVIEEQETEVFQTPEKIFDKAVERVENKRIQYTVMPPAEVFRTATNKPQTETINDRLSKINKSQTIEPKIENLKTAITLNMKIAFVNELFKENVVEYAKAIDRLNNAESLHEALNILAEYREQYKWTGTNNLYNDLDTLVKRRHK